jgi:hypothetical protein
MSGLGKGFENKYLLLAFQKSKSMKLKSTLLLIHLLICAFVSTAQQPTRPEVERSGNYYFGAGVATDENRARDEALSAISSMIAVTVAGSFETSASETDMHYTESATSIIKTYSTATLRNVETIRSIRPDGRIEIFGYIAKSKVSEIYNQRKRLIRSLYEEGQRNEQTGNLAFALKQWYFAIVLLKSIPEQHVVVEGTNLTVELPASINKVLQGLRFETSADHQISTGIREIGFRATYSGRPVSLLHYRFWDGRDNNGIGQVRDGLSTIRLAGSSASFDRITLYPQYEYYTARTENKTVEELWELIKRPEFDNAITISLKEENLTTLPPKQSGTIPTQLTLECEEEISVFEQILGNAEKLIHLLNADDRSTASGYFKNDSFLSEKVSDYMLHNKPRVIGSIQNAVISRTRTGFEVRKIRVLHTYPTINRQATEYLVLDFDGQGALTDLNLCITDDLYKKFVSQADFARDWEQRQEIIKFVEKYRTAYHTRDMNTIDLMFAEEALILIGRKIETHKVKHNEVAYNRLPGQPDFETIQLTKKEYLIRQKSIFDYQQDIFIDFSTFDIAAKSNASNVYGVQMRQHYSSTTYADEGYLFLLIDFHEKDPLIYIRAWQPNEWDSSALVNSANFRVFK